MWGVLGGPVRTVPGTVGSAPEKDPRKVFIGGKWAVGAPARGGAPFRGDLSTQTTETTRPRAHVTAEILGLENNFGCLGKPVNSLGSNCSHLTPLLMMPLSTGVKMAGFAHGPGFEIKAFQISPPTQNFALCELARP